jgi:hypothetical protein
VKKPEESPLPADQVEGETTLGEAGRSQASYAADAKKRNLRQLACMLRDARKKLKHHGRHSFMGREAKKELAAAEAEYRNRNLEISAEGEETRKWEKAKV